MLKILATGENTTRRLGGGGGNVAAANNCSPKLIKRIQDYINAMIADAKAEASDYDTDDAMAWEELCNLPNDIKELAHSIVSNGLGYGLYDEEYEPLVEETYNCLRQLQQNKRLVQRNGIWNVRN